VLVAGLANGNIRLKGSTDGFLGVGESNGILYLADWATAAKGLSIVLSSGAATFSSSVTASGSKAQFIADGLTSAGAEILLKTSLTTNSTLRRNWSIATEDQIEGDFVIKSSNVAGGSPITTRLAILSNGNVGIGTSSPTSILNISSSVNNAVTSVESQFRILNTFSGAVATLGFSANNSDGQHGRAGIVSGKDFGSVSGFMAFVTRLDSGSFVERMRILGDGHVLMHATAFNSALVGQLFGSTGDTYFTRSANPILFLNRLSNDGVILTFQKDNAIVGTISTNSNSLPSDLNFKKNISNLELGLNLITKLRAVSYNHKIDDDDAALSTGFIAQEFEQSLTELGVKENEYYILQHKPNEDAKQSQYWLDYTKMIPVLVKAIQELTQKVNALENK
jgi:hypothetical protein